MHYWNLLWDWNNLDAVRTVHSFLEGWALVFFALLVVFDVLAHLAEQNKTRAKTLELIGLVCFGVAVLAEGLAYPYSRRNDTLSNQQSTEQQDKIAVLDNSTQRLRTDAVTARKQAEGFKAQIADADARVRVAEAQVATAKADVANAVAEVATADARIAEAQRGAAEAEARAAEARSMAEADHLERVKIEERLADRMLRPEQVAHIASEVKSAKLSTALEIDPLVGNDEAARYALQISEALSLGGLTPNRQTTILDNALLRTILVCTHTKASESVIANAMLVRDILRRAGVAANMLDDQTTPMQPRCTYDSLPVGEIGILVPAKPPVR